MIWVKDCNEDREDNDVNIFNIIQKIQDTVVHHLEVDEKQWKITQKSKRQAQWVWSPRAMSCLNKNMIASKPSEHPPVRGEMSKQRLLGRIIGCKDKTSSWYLNRFPHGSSNIGSTV